MSFTMRHYRSDCIHDALETVTAQVTQNTLWDWTFNLSNSRVFEGIARVDQEFLHLDVDLRWARSGGSLTAASIWDLLHFNARTQYGVKFALGGKSPSVRLRAELPVFDGQDLLYSRIRDTVHAMRRALRLVQGAADSTQFDSPNPARSGVDLPALLGEVGFSFSRRASGLVVKLDVPDEFFEATIGECTVRGTVASVALEACNGWPNECRTALGLMLLSATARLRMVRASAERFDDNQTAARFEVVFQGLLSAANLNHGLSALSVACGGWGKEVKALRDERVARSYLWIRDVPRIQPA
jgi:hypothetical protein